MIIGTCGFCSTGSSAISDYLKEFDQNQVFDDFEFVIPYYPDGIEDLDYHLNERISRMETGTCAITRFRNFMASYGRSMCKLSSIEKSSLSSITESFLAEITQLKYKNFFRSDELIRSSKFYRFFGWSIMMQRIIPFLNKRFKRCVDLYPIRELEISIAPKGFDEAAREFIRSILKQMGADFNKNIVLDQPFSGDDPCKSFKYFDDPLAIVVDRDPRDNYLFAKEFLYKKGRLIPTDTVEDFVKYYRLVRENRPYQQPNERVLCIRFEDMVYDYSKTTKEINRFCGLPDNPNPLTIFDPKLSIANTQLIRRFPQYENDIRYIEKELSEYLFDFSEFPAPTVAGKMFSGKSPLNK